MIPEIIFKVDAISRQIHSQWGITHKTMSIRQNLHEKLYGAIQAGDASAVAEYITRGMFFQLNMQHYVQTVY